MFLVIDINLRKKKYIVNKLLIEKNALFVEKWGLKFVYHVKKNIFVFK